MSENKKYFWLQLKVNFFNQKEIKKLRSIAGGDTYTIIYLKLQLLSISREARLVYEGVEDDFCREMALEIDESPDDVSITLSYLEKHGLIETTSIEDEYFLPEAFNCIGKTTSEAIRKSKYRERVGHCPVAVPLLSSERPPEKEKEIEIHKEKNTHIKREDMFDLFWNKYGKKVGRENTIKQWNKLSEAYRAKAISSVDTYKRSVTDEKYLKHPERYLSQGVFNDYDSSPTNAVTLPNNSKPISDEQILKEIAEAMAVHN